jgi:hypothetical protein
LGCFPDQIALNWENANVVRVRVPRGATFVRRETEVSGVRIVYENAPD